MQLIVDANIFIAAFLKSSTTRELLLDEDIEFFAPEYFALEIRETLKKDKFLKSRTLLTQEELDEFLNVLLSPIKILPEEKYAGFIEKAKQKVPEDDSPYLALALALQIPIWSNDAAFKKQSLIQAYTTGEVIKIVKSLH